MTLSHKLFSYAGLRLRKACQCSSGCCQAVVHDKFSFVCEVVANGPRLRIGCLPNLLLHMHRNGYDCTSASNIECKIKFSVPGFVQNLNYCQFGRVLDHFGHFKCACAETAIRLLPV